jgi:hypothetical protein
MRNEEDGNVNINSPPCCSIMGKGTRPPQPRLLKSYPPLGKNLSSFARGNSGSSGGSSGMGGSGLKPDWDGSNNNMAASTISTCWW